MSDSKVSRRAAFGTGSIAAAMLMAAPGTAFAAENAGAAAADEAAEGQIVVIGRGEEIDLATMRGPLIDAPQTINVVNREILDDRQATTLADALRNVAGVTTAVGEGGTVNGDQFFIRGQAARDDIFTDGLRDFGAFTRDAFNYESVQVLKGSSSTALGRGVSGGAINTQSKRALAEDRFSFNVAGGTDDYLRGTADANLALSDSSGLRLNIMGHTADTADRDSVYSNRFGFAAAAGFGIGNDTNFDLIFFHQDEDKRVDYGVPIIRTSDTTDIERPAPEFGVPRSNFYGFAADRDKVTVNTLTARFAHQANDWISLTSDTKVGVYTRQFRQTPTSCNDACGDALLDGDPLTVPMVSASARGLQDQTTRGIQNVSTALIEKSLGELRNELIVGWDVSYQTNKRSDTQRPASSVSRPLLNPSAVDAPVYPTAIYRLRDAEATDISLFVDERLWVTPQLSINAGVRYQHFKSSQDTTDLTDSRGEALTSCNGATGSFTSCFTRAEASSDLWSPKASIIWEPSDNASLYLSYSKAAVPPGNSLSNGSLSTPAENGGISGNDLDPETTETFDLGLKLNLFGDKLLVQSAIYQIDRNNAREVDPVTNVTVVSSEPKQRLRGFELGASGAVSADLLLTLNYSYVDAEITEAFTRSGDLDTDAIGRQVRYVPKHSASLWAAYKPVEGSLKGLEIGVGGNYQSKVFLDSQNSQVAPSYVAVDGLLAYDFGKYRIAINGYNLTNKLYYSQVNSSRVVPAAGRSFLASFGVSF